MGRKVQARSDEDEGRWHFMEIDGNDREDPDPFRIRFRPMTTQEYLRRQRANGRLNGKSPNFVALGQERVEDTIREHVLEVRGYVVEDMRSETPKLVQAKNGRELLEAAKIVSPAEYQAVTAECMRAIQGECELEEDVEKKSNSRSA